MLNLLRPTAAAPVDTLRPPSLATESWLEYGRRPTPNVRARRSGPAAHVAMEPRELCGRANTRREPLFQRALRAPQPSTLYSCSRDWAAIFIASPKSAFPQRHLCICCLESLCVLHLMCPGNSFLLDSHEERLDNVAPLCMLDPNGVPALQELAVPDWTRRD